MKAKIIITGASGYIGSYLLKELQRYDIVCLEKAAKKLDKKMIIADIRDKTALKRIKGTYDVIIHLAAIVGSYNKKLNYDINVKGTKNMIRLAKRLSVKQFIYISSVSAIRHKQGPYGKTKLEGERILRNSGLIYTILRPTTVIGRESLGLARILKNIHRFPFFIPLVGSGKYTSQPIYIHDLVKIIHKIILNKKVYQKTYDVGGSKRFSFSKLVKIISRMEGINKLLIPIPVGIVKIVAKIFERIFTHPPFTFEHVLSLTEDTAMDIRPLQEDIKFKPTSLNKALKIILEEIHTNPPKLYMR